jgi:L-threonylcarbamoyladenylate synthase
VLKTEILKINRLNPEIEKIRHAAQIIKKGGLVVFPTETVYGLGANAFDEDAVRKVFKVKGRPPDNPLIVHIADINYIKILTKGIPPKAKELIKKFWPGPLTIVLKKSNKVLDIVTAGSDAVALRMPDNKIALSLIKECGLPLVAPSANRSGRPSPTRTKDVIEDMEGLVDLIIDGGTTKIGIESTVIDMTVDIPTILRPGAITVEAIEKTIGDVGMITLEKSKDGLISATIEPVKSPGIKYKHYAPKAELIIVEGKVEDVQKKIEIMAEEAIKDKKKVGVITFRKGTRYKDCIVFFCGSDPKTIAKRLFSILREMDRRNVDIIISEFLKDKGIGLAVADRLKRASGFNIIKA